MWELSDEQLSRGSWTPCGGGSGMIFVNRLRPHRGFSAVSRLVALPPITLSGLLLHAARALWIVMAAASLLIWIVETPLFYQAAQQLQSTNGMFDVQPATWRLGLHQLGISTSAYAAHMLIVQCLMTGSMFLTGLLIFFRRSDEWVALLVSYTFVTLGVGIMNAYAGGPALLKIHPELHQFLHTYLGLSDLAFGALFLIPLVFPDGRFVPRWTWVLAAAFYVPLIAPSGSALDYTQLPAWISYPLAILWYGTVLLSPIYRYRRVSDFTQREQTKWVIFGLAVAIGIFLALGLLQAFVPALKATPERRVLLDMAGVTAMYLGFSFLPVCFAIAILRHRLWDIDLILNRTLVYGTLTASVIGFYVLSVIGLGALFQTRGTNALSLPATVLVAILFHPLRERLQRGVNRLMYGDRDEPYAVISRLGRQLEGTLAPDAVLPAIVRTVAQALKLPYAAIALRQETGLVTAATTGAPSGELLRLPLAYQGDSVGELVLGPRPGEGAFSAPDRRLLDDLARQAGVAASAVRLTADLQRSRERLVTAREEERRRLRRDLHDGLGPTLASMLLQAETAQDLLRRDPAESEALLAGLIDQLSTATADIRRLVYNLRPPSLDDLGLLGAIRAQARKCEHPALRIQLDLPDIVPSLPAAVEVAVLRIVQEALTNVVRHAAAGSCALRLTVTDRLELEITDDGAGFPAQAGAGVGVLSMRERAEELGGYCRVELGPAGGVQVRALLPITLAPHATADREK
jgi:signal transduction histidine kinase